MEVVDINNEQSEKRYHSYIKAMDECPLCTTELEIVYRVDKEHSKVHEEAQCPSCKVKASNKVHDLQ